ncbi:MAG: hypothetical protein K8T89_24870, partial [Planctomycetes bacterium]|nr:hypothetical protein [Planctomycetota bacterium]
MAATFVIACPDCGKQLKVADNLIGKKIRCKECDGIFPVRKPKEDPVKKESKEKPKNAAKPAPLPKKPADDDDDDPNQYGLAQEGEERARCPACVKELESNDARICLHCGYDLLTRKRAEVKKIYQATGEEKFKWLLPGILC